MPGYYTEELLDDEWDELSARKSFFDVIHNHLYPLLYQAWLKYKLSHNVVEFSDQNYSEIIFSLIGLGKDYRAGYKDSGHLLKYSGLLSQRVKSLLGLKTLLQDRLGDIKIDIRPCVQRKVTIVKKQRCLLGEQNTRLGADLCIGQEVIDRSGKFNVEIGPLDAAQFSQMTSESVLIDRVKEVLKLYMVQPLEYSLTLLLEPGAIQPARIGEIGSSSLGGNCWLIAAANKQVERIELMGDRL